MRDRVAKLRLRTASKTGDAVLVLLQFSTSPWVGPANTLRISTSSEALKRSHDDKKVYVRPMQPEAKMWAKLQAVVDSHKCLTIQIRIDGPIEPAEPSDAPVALRIHAIGYAAPHDFAARINLLEQMVLPSV